MSKALSALRAPGFIADANAGPKSSCRRVQRTNWRHLDTGCRFPSLPIVVRE